MERAKSNGKGKATGMLGAPPQPKNKGKDSGKGFGGYLAKAEERKRVAAEAVPASSPHACNEVAHADVDPWLEEPSNALSEVASDRFEVGDPLAMYHLEEHGYVVLASVMDAEHCERAEQLLFEFMDEHVGWKRGDPSTWTDESLTRCSSNGLANGIINKRGAHHSELNWYVRTLPRVRQVFECVWATSQDPQVSLPSDLITSFDCFGLFRPWHAGFFKTAGGWFHVDQGTPGKQCIQGLISVFDQDRSTGGLIVIPGSHRRFHELQVPETNVDYIEVGKECPLWAAPHRLVHMRAGDLVLWDSRTVHCNTPATVMPTAPKDRLLRAVVYICMTPREFARSDVLEQRREAYNMCKATTHWPHKNMVGFEFNRQPKLDYGTAPPERKALI